MASETEDPKASDGGAASKHVAPRQAVSPDLAQMPFETGVVIHGKYELLRPLGSGGVGCVVAARHIGFDDLVALKFLRPEFATHQEAVSRFTIEARASFKLRSEHVARMLDVDLYEGVPFIAMELLEGTDLRNLLEVRQVLEVERAVDYLLQTCEALASAHTLGVIHRDVKPENLFLLGDGDATDHLKVLDFGISKVAVRGESRRTHQALTRIAVGTPPYMSPEQVRASTALDARSDIWSVGCVLYELITGTAPFERVSLMQACAAVLEDEPAAPCELRPALPKELSEVIMRCLRKDPTARFDDVASLAEALSPFGSGRLDGYPGRCRAHLAGEGLGRRSTPTGYASVQRNASAGPEGKRAATGISGAATHPRRPSGGVESPAAARMISVRLESHAPLTRRTSMSAASNAPDTAVSDAAATAASDAAATAASGAKPRVTQAQPARAARELEPGATRLRRATGLSATSSTADVATPAAAAPKVPKPPKHADPGSNDEQHQDAFEADPLVRAPRRRIVQVAAWGLPIVFGGLLATYLATAEQRARSVGPSLHPASVRPAPDHTEPELSEPEPEPAESAPSEQELANDEKPTTQVPERNDGQRGSSAPEEELAQATAGTALPADAQATADHEPTPGSSHTEGTSRAVSKHVSSSHAKASETKSRTRTTRPSNLPPKQPQEAAALNQQADPDVGF